MQIEEFMTLVAGEPEQVVAQTVWIPPSEVLAKAAKSGGVSMTDFLSAPGRRAELRDVRYRHIVGPAASQPAIDVSLKRRSLPCLPPDLRALVTKMNGIHLWAKVETGRSYVGLAPIEEWDLARVKLPSSEERSFLDDRYVAVSYHQDDASFVVLDVDSGTYFLMDAAGSDTSSPMASNVEGLLDWLWRSRIAPRASGGRETP